MVRLILRPGFVIVFGLAMLVVALGAVGPRRTSPYSKFSANTRPSTQATEQVQKPKADADFVGRAS